MSRSYRYNPDDTSVSNCPAWERTNSYGDLGEATGEARPARRSTRRKKSTPIHPPMSEEWAMELMAPNILGGLSGLAERSIIAPHEIDDYTQILNAHICRILPLYDEEHVGKRGVTASVERYLTVAVNSALTDIAKLALSRKATLPVVPMPTLADDEDIEDESKCSDNHYVSDNCRSIKDLWFRMDVAVLSEMLTPEQRIALNLRMEGYTYPEIADEVSRILGVKVDRFHIMMVTMEYVRKAARKCGFAPAGESKGEDS